MGVHSGKEGEEELQEALQKELPKIRDHPVLCAGSLSWSLSCTRLHACHSLRLPLVLNHRLPSICVFVVRVGHLIIIYGGVPEPVRARNREPQGRSPPPSTYVHLRPGTCTVSVN